MTWDWPTYFHDYGQENSKYQLVNPTTAINLLEKYVHGLIIVNYNVYFG